MSTTVTTKRKPSTPSSTQYRVSFREKWDMGQGEMFLRYGLLALMLVISVGPFIWQLSTSLKGVGDDIYSFPPSLIPTDFTFENYASVTRTIPVIKYAWHSLLIASGSIVSNVLFATLAGYAFGVMKFRFKGLFLALILSTLLLPAEVTLGHAVPAVQLRVGSTHRGRRHHDRSPANPRAVRRDAEAVLQGSGVRSRQGLRIRKPQSGPCSRGQDCGSFSRQIRELGAVAVALPKCICGPSPKRGTGRR